MPQILKKKKKRQDWEFQQGIETLKLDQMKILKLKKKNNVPKTMNTKRLI